MSSLGAEAVSSCDDDRVETLFLFEAVAIETLASSGASSLNEGESEKVESTTCHTIGHSNRYSSF